MDQEQEEEGTLEVLLLRFKDYRLPRAERLLEHVNSGGTLSNYDIQWLERVMKDGRRTAPLVRKHHEYDELVSRAMQLFAEIIEKGVANEGQPGV